MLILQITKVYEYKLINLCFKLWLQIKQKNYINLTIFGCYNSFNKEISLIAVLGIPSSSEVSLIFFKAYNSFVVFSRFNVIIY